MVKSSKITEDHGVAGCYVLAFEASEGGGFFGKGLSDVDEHPGIFTFFEIEGGPDVECIQITGEFHVVVELGD